eukprot:scaffold11394_cov183-Amphora_coffeaeformis.AAC.8
MGRSSRMTRAGFSNGIVEALVVVVVVVVSSDVGEGVEVEEDVEAMERGCDFPRELGRDGAKAQAVVVDNTTRETRAWETFMVSVVVWINLTIPFM